MSRFRIPLVPGALFALLTLPAAASSQLDARMLQQPAVSASEIAFVYAGDIWVVPKTGGVANRLSSPRGEESFPRFSPDGSRIAFTADYDGNQDVYVMPAAGGDPQRVTHHPMPDRVLGWYPDGKSLLYASGMESGRQRFDQFYRVAATGGMPTKLPVPYGEFGAVSADGQWLAYMPKSRAFRNWKRYRGGWAPDIWLFNLRTFESKNITDNPANDEQPMWHGDTLYFLSDRGPEQRGNIWAYDVRAGTTRQVTNYSDYDIQFPSIGPSDIVFEKGARLFLLDLRTEQAHEVHVQVYTDRATLRPRLEMVGELLQSADISPTGQRVLVQARGDVFTLPAEHGVVRDLTQSSGVAERWPTWSPDGSTIAYFSDRSGEYELTIRPADGSGTESKLTSLGAGFRYRPQWSPDSRKLAFIDKAMDVWIFDRDTGKPTKIDHALRYFEGSLEGFTANWSPDSRWLTYAIDLPNQRRAIILYDTRSGQRHQVTSAYYDDASPVFDPDGKYLYFNSTRTFDSMYSDYDNSWIYANGTTIIAVPLRAGVPSPLAAQDDSESVKAAAGAAHGDTSKAAASAAPVEIDLAGFEQREVTLPPAAGNYGGLAAAAGKVIYLRQPRTGSVDTTGTLVYYDLKDRKEHTIAEAVGQFTLSADGRKLLVSHARKLYIMDVKEQQKFEHPLATDQMAMTVDPVAEWHQIFNDVWRFDRDYFYDPNMHGVDWPAMRKSYGALLDQAVTRSDVNFVIDNLIAELSSSHTYNGGGSDLDVGLRRGVGLLGVDWSLENGAYRIKRIIRGAPWDAAYARSPLDVPGVDVHAGDYVLAVNGIPMDTAADPWAAFEGLDDRTVSLTVNARPTMQGARQVIVHTMSDETQLRNYAWVEGNRALVDSLSHGRVGYVYVPSTGADGQEYLERQVMAQYDKDGLVVDERFNSGGQIPDRFIELLDRPALSFWAVRDGQDWRWPPYGHFGPEVMLINGWSGSGGDAFPYYFREAGLGPLIGERTWGGLIGISGVPGLIDGGAVTVPTFRLYNPKGEWFPEGHGVEPDIKVVDDPTLMAKGSDPQLDAGVQEVLKEMAAHPAPHPARPPYQNRGRPGAGGGGRR